AANRRFNLGLEFDQAEIGLESLESHGTTFPDETVERMKQSDGIILGPLHTAIYPPPEEGGPNPSGGTRKALDLYANIRPSRVRPGCPAHVKKMDLVIVRENTEGFYADRNMFMGRGEFMPTPDMAISMRKVTREGCMRIAETACALAKQRSGKLTMVHKGNVMKMSDGLFAECVNGVAASHGLEVDEYFIDAMTALLVRIPDSFDVVVTTNMYGDILSDLAAELSGGLGLGPSINAGSDHCIAQAAHGSAPDIAGKNIANPTAMILSCGMLLNWLGQRHGRPELQEAAKRIDEVIEDQLAQVDGRTADLGGPLATDAFGDAVANKLAG
ncbi:MAG: isocitrate/isopropylmalate family dehydrogenase, partial [Pseudomonadota bacterium]